MMMLVKKQRAFFSDTYGHIFAIIIVVKFKKTRIIQKAFTYK